MDEGSLQVGKTRYSHYCIAYHLVWIPKYRRKILTTEVQAATKRLIIECCERHGLTLLALETDEDHIHVCVSASPRLSPALIANPAQRIFLTVLALAVPASQEGVWEGSFVDFFLLCRNSRK